MLRPLPIVLAVVLAVGLALAAPPAAAEELGLLVERTTPVGEPVRVVLTSDLAGPVEIRATRLGDPAALLAEPALLRSAPHLAWLAGVLPEAGTAPRREADGLRRLTAPHPLGTFPVRIAKADTREGFDLALQEPGLYVLEARRGNRLRAHATALVSDLALVTKRHPQGLLLWSVHRETGKPWPGVTVTVADPRRAPAIHGTTDAHGLVRLERSLPPTVEVRAQADGHLAFGAETWFPVDVNDRRVYVFPHQPAYRPGERIEVKGIVRASTDGRLHLDPSAQEASLRLHDSRDQLIETKTVPISADLGTFAGSFELPKDAPTGTYRIGAQIRMDAYEASVRVEAYRKPAFEVRVEPTQPRLLAGGRTTFTISASFYDGGPLDRAAVSWQLMHNRVDHDLFPTDEIARLFFGTERSAYTPVALATGEGTLDAHGRLAVEAEAPPAARDGWLSLRAVVTGPDRIAVAGSGGCAVAATPVRVGLETDRHLYGPEDVVGVEVRVEQADGRPAAGRAGELRVTDVTPIPPHMRRLPWSKRLAFETDAEGRAHVQVPLPSEGHFRLQATVLRTADEPAGPPIGAHRHVWAAADQPTLGLAPADLEIVVDRDRYAVGEAARVLVRAPAGHALLTALEGSTLLDAAVRLPEAGAAVWSIPILDAHAPNVFVTVALVQHGTLRVESRMLRVPPVHRLLTTEIQPDAGTLQPGERTGVTVRVRDARGRPVEGAEVALAVVDEALHALFADPAARLEAFFHPTRRNGVGTGGVLHHDAVGVARYQPPPKKRVRAREGATGAVPPGLRQPADEAPPAPAEAPATPSPGAAAAEPRAEESGDEDDPLFGAEAEEGRGFGGRAGKEDGRGQPAPVVARKDFRSCVYWGPALRTDAEGVVRIESIELADSLTRWRVSAKTVDAATRVGTGTAAIVARKQVSARLTTPRFLRVTDTVEMPLLLRNHTDRDTEITWTAEVRQGEESHASSRQQPLAARARLVETVVHRAAAPGALVVKGAVESPLGSDAEERGFPVHPQGIERVAGYVARSRDGVATLEARVPRHAVPGTVRGRISVEPSYVAAVAAALPYLAAYPHGCTEQTLNRFLPVVAAVDAVKKLNVPAQGLLAELPDMVDAGVKRLAELRHDDGGFGWWPSDASDPLMTALVVRGLNRVARHLEDAQGLEVLRRDAAKWLRAWTQAGGRQRPLPPAGRASVVLALAGANVLPEGALEGAVAARDETDPLATALLLRAARVAKRAALVRSLRAELERLAIRENGRAHWSRRRPAPGGEAPAVWHEDPIETTAEVLRALLWTGGSQDLLADGAEWLVLNRPGGDRWRSTRDTAAAVQFLADYAAATGDLGAGTIVEVLLDGEALGHVELTRETLFDQGTVLSVPPGRLKPGATLHFVLQTASGAFTTGLNLRFFEAGPAIAAGENGLGIRRRWYLLEPERGEAGVTWRRTPLSETVPSGALVECELEITSPEAREYLMVTDLLAAGFEPAREYGVRVPGRDAAAEAEIERYDDRTLFFVSRMPPGTIRLRHTVRATHVGTFTALPAIAELMYFPDVRGNAAGEVLEITAAGPAGTEKGGGR